MSNLSKAIEYVKSFPHATTAELLERIQEADSLFDIGPGDAVRLRHQFCFW